MCGFDMGELYEGDECQCGRVPPKHYVGHAEPVHRLVASKDAYAVLVTPDAAVALVKALDPVAASVLRNAYHSKPPWQ